MTFRRFLRWFLWTVLCLVVLVALVAGSLWWYFHPSVQRTNAIVYGKRGDRELGLDVINGSSRRQARLADDGVRHTHVRRVV